MTYSALSQRRDHGLVLLLIKMVLASSSTVAFSDPTLAAGLTLSVTATSPESVVLNTVVDSCMSHDSPDAPARAFRDFRGTVHLIASETTGFQLTGTSLDAVTHSCSPIYQSSQNSNPSNYQDESWLYAFYTKDGRNIDALLHNEYHGWSFGNCSALSPTIRRQTSACLYDAVSAASSTDGGYHFTNLPVPKNFVAGVSLPYGPLTEGKANGFYAPTNIVPFKGFFYSLVSVWTLQSQNYSQLGGACIIRTATPEDPSSWRGWDGTGFHARFNDPYLSGGNIPVGNTCEPLKHLYEPTSLTVIDDTLVALENAVDARFGGPPGVYASISSNGEIWSKPYSIFSDKQLLAMDTQEPRDKKGLPIPWTYGYFSLIDPNSSDLNFATSGPDPYLFYIKFDPTHGPYRRWLLKRHIHIALSSQ